MVSAFALVCFLETSRAEGREKGLGDCSSREGSEGAAKGEVVNLLRRELVAVAFAAQLAFVLSFLELERFGLQFNLGDGSYTPPFQSCPRFACDELFPARPVAFVVGSCRLQFWSGISAVFTSRESGLRHGSPSLCGLS
jgi:hypothetical protein